MSENTNNNELDFEQRINETFGDVAETTDSATAQRLKDVNKKLPSWNLEPPMNFIK